MWNPFKKKGGGSIFGRLDYASYEEPPQEEVIVKKDFEDDPEPSREFEEKEPEEKEEKFTENLSPKLEKTAKWILLLVVALVPVWFLPFTAPNDVLVIAKQILVYLAVMAVLVLWVIMIMRQGGLILRRSGWEWGVLAVFVASLLSTSFSAQVYSSFLYDNGLVSLVILVALFFLVVNIFKKEELGRVINFFSLGSAVAVLVQLLAVMGVPFFKLLGLLFPKGLMISNQFNTVGSANGLGALAALSLVLLVAYHLASFSKVADGGNKFWSISRIVSIVIFSLWLVAINWWVFYTVVVVGMVGVILSFGFHERITGLKAKFSPLHLVLPMVFLVAALVLILGNRFLDLDVSKVFKKDFSVEASLSQSGSWEIAKRVANIKPVFGYGSENFILAYDQFKPKSVNSSLFWNSRFGNATSEFFNLAIEQGLVGVAAFVFLLFFVFKSAFKKKFTHSEGQEANQDRRGEYLWVILPAFLASLALFALYPFNFVLLAVFWLMLAMMGVALVDESNNVKIKMDDASLPSLATSLILVVALIGGIMGGSFIFQRYSGNIFFAQAVRITGTSQEDLNHAIDLLNKAISADNHNDLYLGNLGTLLLRRIDNELNNKKDKPEEVRARLEALTRSAVQVANQMTTNHKNDAINWFNAAFVYENLTTVLSGADEAAISGYKEYLKRAPQDPNGYVRIGSIYLARADRTLNALIDAKNKKLTIRNEKEVTDTLASDYHNAEENLKKAIELKPDLATALYSLGIVYERQNKIKEAIKQLEILRTGNTNNPGLAFELGLLYYRDGQKDRALTEMTRAVTIFSDYANARWYSALMLEERGQVDLALDQLQKIISMEVNKDNPVVKTKIASLKAGKREIPPEKVTGKKPLE